MDFQPEFIAVLFLIISIFAAPSAGCEWYALKTFILPDFKDKAVSDFLLSIHPGIEKLWACTMKCRFDTRCISYQFNDLTNTCSLFGCGFSYPYETFLPTTAESGWQLYAMVGRDQSFGHACTASGDCDYVNSFCRDGRCECDLGYSYDPNTGGCVTYCDVYGNTFQVQNDVSVWGHNTGIYRSKSYSECLNDCIAMSSYVCRSIEVETVDYCTMSNSTWFSINPEERDTTTSSGWLYLTRHCAVTTGH